MAPRSGEKTTHSWQILCKRAAVERDPVRLLALFLWIDLLATQKAEEYGKQPEQVVRPRVCLASCPHCSAIIRPEGQVPRDRRRCPWCMGAPNEPEYLPA